MIDKTEIQAIGTLTYRRNTISTGPTISCQSFIKAWYHKTVEPARYNRNSILHTQAHYIKDGKRILPSSLQISYGWDNYFVWIKTEKYKYDKGLPVVCSNIQKLDFNKYSAFVF